MMKGVKWSDKVPAVKQAKSAALQVQQNTQENLQKKIPLSTKKQRHYCLISLDPQPVRNLEKIWERSAVLSFACSSGIT